MLRRDLHDLIKRAIKEANLNGQDFSLESPEEKTHGDYATNAALKISRVVKMPPLTIARDLKPRMLNLASDLLEKIEIAEPGFINFFISKKYLQKQIAKIPEKIDIGRGKKISIESISANPTGSLHIGNGRNAFTGDAIANVLEKAGFQVTREYYVNNAKNSKQILELGKTALGQGATYLTEKLKTQIARLRPSASFGTAARQAMLAESEAGYRLAKIVQEDTRNFLEKKLRIKFNRWIFEEEDIYQKGKIKKILEWLRNNQLVYEKEGALWLKTSQFGDEKDWVVVRETGEPTYLLSDIAYHKDKFDRGFDRVIDIWGADHQAHVSKIKAVGKMLSFMGALDVLVLQLVALRGGEKMSKRAGNIIMLEELVDEIGADVARWFYLQKSLDTHTEIDLELAKEQSEKNPVYYVQYAHARMCSILKKSEIRNMKSETNSKLLNHPSELNLIKQLIKFPEIVEDTASDYQVQRLPQYAMDLAAAFHQFYHDCRVISEDKHLTQARLALVSVAKTVLKDTLSLMGVSAPENM